MTTTTTMTMTTDLAVILRQLAGVKTYQVFARARVCAVTQLPQKSHKHFQTFVYRDKCPGTVTTSTCTLTMQQAPPIKTKSRTKPSTMSPETTRPQPLNQAKTRENHHEKHRFWT